MKQLLFILLLVGWGVTGWGQPLIIKGDSVKLGGVIIINTVITLDTIKVLIQYSDTSTQNGFRSRRVEWMKGWEILPIKFPYADLIINLDGTPYEPESIYLDEYKKPLPKNFVVWMAKEIK